MEPLGIIKTAHLFPGLHRHLMEMLHDLSLEDWTLPTLAREWTVRDVAAHLLDGQVRRLSFQRDLLQLARIMNPNPGYAELVAHLNELNSDWIRAMRRVSPGVLMQFLEVTGPQVADLFAALDPRGPAFFPVTWADETESENWFDVGREYTEWWHHQAQIREAVGAPALAERVWLHPLLELSMLAFRRGFRDIAGPTGTAFVFQVTGDAGGTWSIVSKTDGWQVFRGEAPDAAARACCDADTAWRLFFNALTSEQARSRISAQGDAAIIERLESVRGVMV